MSAIEYAGYALAVNFSILIVPGQIFFLIIQEAGRSREDAMLAALGVALAEVVLLLLLFMGFTIYLRQLIPLLRWVGAILLFTLGVQSIMRTRQPTVVRIKRPGAAAFYRGFLTTGLNPPFIIWLFTVGFSNSFSLA
jgi:threonine/homoserine/homoserine lactone efflux protein